MLSSLLRRGHSPEWLLTHRLNSLQRSISSLVDCGTWVVLRLLADAKMLFNCAVSFAVSCPPLGQWFIYQLVNGSILGCWLQVAGDLVTCWLPRDWFVI